jgi:hypothetical protein
MATTRKPPGRVIEKEVLTASRRRCCLCVFLNNQDEPRKGQIAHLNRNSSDSRFENLVFLCLEHHDDYDTRTSQSKAFLPDEVREYRDLLYARYREFKTPALEHAIKEANAEIVPLPDTSQYDVVRQRFPKQLDFTSKPWRFPLWQVANRPEFFAYKAPNGADGVCLIERIDLPDERIVVVCIATAGNPGISITNCVEELCFQVCERFEIPPECLVWLEHYDYFKPAEWMRVTFARRPPNGPFKDPQWTTMTPEMWRELSLRPKERLGIRHGEFESKVTKLFDWPIEGIF